MEYFVFTEFCQPKFLFVNNVHESGQGQERYRILVNNDDYELLVEGRSRGLGRFPEYLDVRGYSIWVRKDYDELGERHLVPKVNFALQPPPALTFTKEALPRASMELGAIQTGTVPFPVYKLAPGQRLELEPGVYVVDQPIKMASGSSIVGKGTRKQPTILKASKAFLRCKEEKVGDCRGQEYSSAEHWDYGMIQSAASDTHSLLVQNIELDGNQYTAEAAISFLGVDFANYARDAGVPEKRAESKEILERCIDKWDDEECGKMSWNQGIRIKDCTVHHFAVQGIIVNYAVNVEITGNHIYNISYPGMPWDNAARKWVEGPNRFLSSRLYFSTLRNQAWLQALKSYDQHFHALYLTGVANVVVKNNHFAFTMHGSGITANAIQNGWFQSNIFEYHRQAAVSLTPSGNDDIWLPRNNTVIGNAIR